MKKKCPKIGLALGAGGARGFTHIGVLKVLEKHKIFPDYIAGTSMGAVIASAYAAGRSPDEIERIVMQTDWRKIVDFTIPKAGIVQGKKIKNKIRELVFDSEFKDLKIPLRVVAYNLTQKKKVVFSKGDVAEAVRASISIPGIFRPVKIGTSQYIDGGIADPTPFDVVRDMGADIVIAVDLFSKTKSISGSIIRKSDLLTIFKKKFVAEELELTKNLIFPERWPGFIRKIMIWLFDKILYPAKVFRMMAGKERFPIAQVLDSTVAILTNNLARERLEHGNIDIRVKPSFGTLGWSDFDKAHTFVKHGEKAMKEEIGHLKQKLRRC
ncbi:hypothetical protein COV17_04520 [Candidatus Woesearchaeota archaeon CG10_big_fil_rev_8_21_14_0_10_36_11]|nr:MAG: hypothetical protein COV17_04520 [Candidatus Woesearchaeota archaeon CG10_big_fil_rev_8_21_14_0_10_36_11]